MATTNFCSIDCASGTTAPNLIAAAACFTEGFIDASITVDKLDDWASCRTKKTNACEQVESALNDVFDVGMMAGINELKGMTTMFADTATTCKNAWKGQTMNFGSWVLGVVSNPEELGFNLSKAFFVKETRDQISSEMGDMINAMFTEQYYWGAGNNFGTLMNIFFGGPQMPSSEPDLDFLS